MRRILLTCLVCLGCLAAFSQDSVSSDVFLWEGYDSSSVIYDVRTFTQDNARVLLNWESGYPADVDFFSIERSCNGQPFEVVSVLKQSGAAPIHEWTDEAPSKGRNLYRIRCNLKNGLNFFSPTVSAHLAGDISFKFYPNPVDNILILRSESPVDVQILDAGGKLRLQQQQVQGLQLLNVSGLEKGIYLLRVQNRQSNSLQQVKLLKN